MKVILNKEDMISYCNLKKIKKKNKDVPKLGRNWAESFQNWQKLVKNWYYVHFDPKNYIKNSKMRVIQNKKEMISYYQLTKIEKKYQGHPKIRPKFVKIGKKW